MLHEWPVPFLLALVTSLHVCSVWLQDYGYVCLCLFNEDLLVFLAATPSGLAPMPKGVELILVQVKPRAEKEPAALTQEHCTSYSCSLGVSSLGALGSVMSFGDHSSHIPGTTFALVPFQGSLRGLA